MYPYVSMDEEVFLAPESIISDVLAREPADDPTADLDFDADSFPESAHAD